MTGPWRAFRVIPEDVLFFRDGRPSTRGSDHFLKSIFPPHPSTLYGAIRTRRLIDEGISLAELRRKKTAVWATLADSLRQELGEWGEFGSLELRGPWLVRGEEVLMPAPADLGVRIDQESASVDEDAAPRIKEIVRFREIPEREGGHSHPLGLLAPFVRSNGAWKRWPGTAARAPQPVTRWFLTPRGYVRWAAGGLPSPDDFVHPADLWVDELRVGLGMDGGRRTGEAGMLYTFGFIRLLPGVSLGFEIRGGSLAPGRRIRLGGEGRTAWLDDGPAFPQCSAPSASRLRLAFATPALSESGAYPPPFGPDTRIADLQKTRLRLLGASVSGHQPVGGWDLAENRAKPLRQAIPAGSVFIFDSPEASSLTPSTFHGLNLSGFDGENLARQGFGLVLAGADPQET